MTDVHHTFDLLFLFSLYHLGCYYDPAGLDALILHDEDKDENDDDYYIGTYFSLQEIVNHALDMLKPDCSYLNTPAPGRAASVFPHIAKYYLYQSCESLNSADVPCTILAADLDPKLPAGYFDTTPAGMTYMGVLCSNFEDNGIDLEAFKQSTIDGLNEFYHISGYGKSLIEDHIPVDGPVDPFEKS